MTRRNVYVVMNGKPAALTASHTVADYLRFSGYDDAVAASLNGHLLSGSAKTSIELHEGDIVEVAA